MAGKNLGLAEFPPAMANAEVDQFLRLNHDEVAAARGRMTEIIA
jgi:hypothetical protein